MKRTAEGEIEMNRDKAEKSRFWQNPYLGLVLILAWFYCLWFEPNSFYGVELLSWNVTVAWLASIFVMAATFVLIPFGLRKRRALSDFKYLGAVCTGVLCLGTLVLNEAVNRFPFALGCFVIPGLIGASAAVLWILWGELYARNHMDYNEKQLGTAFGIVVIIGMVLVFALPPLIGTIITAALPLVSCILLYRENKTADEGKKSYPRLLPKETRWALKRHIVIVSGTAFLANVICYFTVAIIPSETLPLGSDTFTLGVICGALGMLAIALVCRFSPLRLHLRFIPWMLVMTVAAIIFYIGGDGAFNFPAFVIALGLASIFELTLVMYSGILTLNGYVKPATAYGLCGFCTLGGIFVGNGIAVFFEQHAYLEPAFLTPVAITLTILLVFALLPFVRQEQCIREIITPVETASELEDAVKAAAMEFNLTKREEEILYLLAKGYTAEGIARQLIISNYTVQTHVQHIYVKTNIHRRSELIRYLNRRPEEA